MAWNKNEEQKRTKEETIPEFKGGEARALLYRIDNGYKPTPVELAALRGVEEIFLNVKLKYPN